MSDLPEPDRMDGVPHPKETRNILGHTKAMDGFLEAVQGERLHHAWMITGPKGIGKATLAYQLAAFLLTQEDGGGFFAPEPITNLDVDPNHPVVARIQAGSEPGLFVLRRPVDDKTKKLKTVITVDAVRALRKFFAMSAGGNGRRIVIVDAVDEMNDAAANALLKVLEEPPEKAMLFLVTHQPSRILPTIRSRCRTLPCDPLSLDDLNTAFNAALPDTGFDPGLYTLSAGSVGTAIHLAQMGGLNTYTDLVAMFSKLPSIDRGVALKLAGSGTRPKPEQFEMTLNLIDMFLSRMARAPLNAADMNQAASGEREVFARFSPDLRAARIWADMQLQLGQRARRGFAVNLDPSALILDTVFKIEETAAQIVR